jgi:hypothetical protein
MIAGRALYAGLLVVNFEVPGWISVNHRVTTVARQRGALPSGHEQPLDPLGAALLGPSLTDGLRGL